MSEIAEKIAEILKDPESLGMINGIAKSFMEEEKTEEPKKENVGSDKIPFSSPKTEESEGGDENGEETETNSNESTRENSLRSLSELPQQKGKTQSDVKGFLSKLRKILDGGSIDNTLRLIAALKPYMRPERKANAERVTSFLQTARLLEGISPGDMARILSENTEKR